MLTEYKPVSGGSWVRHGNDNEPNGHDSQRVAGFKRTCIRDKFVKDKIAANWKVEAKWIFKNKLQMEMNPLKLSF